MYIWPPAKAWLRLTTQQPFFWVCTAIERKTFHTNWRVVFAANEHITHSYVKWISEIYKRESERGMLSSQFKISVSFQGPWLDDLVGESYPSDDVSEW